MKQNMKRLIILVFALSLFSCAKDKYKAESYFSESQKDTLLTNIITYVFEPATYATKLTKFQPQFRSFYVKNLPNFSLENYYQAPDGWNYFFLIRPVGASKYKRGVIGKFKLKENSLKPEAFEEIVNTPHLDEATVKERASFLFKEVVKNRNLDKYLPMKHYVEWPDEHLAYDKKAHEWIVIKPY